MDDPLEIWSDLIDLIDRATRIPIIGDELPETSVFGAYTADVSRHANGGEQHLFFFENGRGASVVQHDFSYGHEEGLWELAVLKGSGAHDYALDYTTPVTGDVLPYLTVEEVSSTLDAIRSLSPTTLALNP